MATILSAQDVSGTAPRLPLARVIWLIAVQVVVLGLAALALIWVPRSEAPPAALQGLLLLLAGMLLVTAIIPRWRNGAVTSMVTGIALATACWLAADTLWDLSHFADNGTRIPLLAPIVLGSALVLAVWGALTRTRLSDPARYGVAALIGAVGLTVLGILFALVIDCTPLFRKLYEPGIELWQVEEYLSVVWLYLPALWLGSTCVRPATRGIFLPIGMAILLIGMLMCWGTR